MELLTKALQDAKKELVQNHGWFFGDFDEFKDSPFFLVMEKHLSPLMGIEEYKKARIAALKAELEELEK